jgi:hypothetical protein
MAVAAFLDQVRVEATPGEEATREVKLRNTGQVVDQFSLRVLGDAAAWTTVEPPIVNLLPGDESSVRVVFAPPRSSEVLAGARTFGVMVSSREDPNGSTVVEGEVDVAGFTEIAAELVPPKGRGRRRGKYRLVVDNTGNQPCAVRIVAADPEDAVDIVLAHPVLETEPGTATFVRTKVIPYQRFLRGQPRTHGFQLVTMPDGQDPITADGVLTQGPLLPRWLLPLVALGVAAAIALVALWFAVVKPTVQTAAREEAREQAIADSGERMAAVAAAADQAETAAKQADESAKDAGAAVTSAKGEAEAAAEASGTVTGTPTTFRLAGDLPPVTDGSYREQRYVAPDRQVLAITDIIMQNPRGDLGYLRIILDGEVELEVGLANIRDLDYHYLQPLVVPANKPVVVAVNCLAPGTPEVDTCTPAVSFSGRLRR